MQNLKQHNNIAVSGNKADVSKIGKALDLLAERISSSHQLVISTVSSISVSGGFSTESLNVMVDKPAGIELEFTFMMSAPSVVAGRIAFWAKLMESYYKEYGTCDMRSLPKARLVYAQKELEGFCFELSVMEKIEGESERIDEIKELIEEWKVRISSLKNDPEGWG